MFELKQDILNCQELWALLHKWLGPAKNLRLGQITYRIFQLARDLGSRGVDTGEGSTNAERRLSVACREECEDLFAEAERAIAAKKVAINRTPNPIPKLCIVRGMEDGLVELRNKRKELEDVAKLVEKELQDFIVSIDTLNV